MTGAGPERAWKVSLGGCNYSWSVSGKEQWGLCREPSRALDLSVVLNGSVVLGLSVVLNLPRVLGLSAFPPLVAFTSHPCVLCFCASWAQQLIIQ